MSDNHCIDAAFVRRLKPFRDSDAIEVNALLPLFARQSVFAGKALDLRTWVGQLVYLVKGELKLDLPDSSTQVLVGGMDDTLQPLGRWGGMPCAAKAITDIELLLLNEDKLDEWLVLEQLDSVRGEGEVNPGVDDTKPVDWRMIENMFAAESLRGGIFKALPVAEMQALLRRFERIHVRCGETLVRQNEEGDFYYLIESGRCTVSRHVSGSPLILAELGAGDAFGEEALVNDTSRNASVVMKSDGMVLRLSKRDFVDLLRSRILHPVSRAEAEGRVANGALWLDVRFAAEYQFDGIKGARNIPLGSLREACGLLDPQQEYIVYCQNGHRSAAAAFLLAQRGFRACLLEGGLAGSSNDAGRKS